MVTGLQGMMDIDLADIAYPPTTGVRRAHETPVVIASDPQP
jgi:hypothetical protein